MGESHSLIEPESKVGVVGLGFVGLALACAFVRKGFQVIGIDLDASKIKQLQAGKSYVQDITDEELGGAISSGLLKVSADYKDIGEANSIIICVPTPLTQFHTPDLSYLTDTCGRLVPYLKHGQLVVVESSTFTGTTREVAKPILEKCGLKVGTQLHLAYSPERTDPGSRYALEAIPKLVSGMTERCLEKVVSLYSQVFNQVVAVSSPEVAETAKLLENSFRLVNISFINEFAQVCDKMNVNVWEVIEAASTKPYGFTAFYPGPGAGGHCIPVDPLYLQWKAKLFGSESKFIELSKRVNDNMPHYIIARLRELLSPKKPLSEASVLIYGVTYKKDTPDIRESSALAIIDMLHKEGVNVAYHDPLISALKINNATMVSVNMTEHILKSADCVLIHTDHTGIPVDIIAEHAPLVFDCRNVTKGKDAKSNIVVIGGGSA